MNHLLCFIGLFLFFTSAFPSTAQVFTETTKAVANDRGNFDLYGFSVAMGRDFAVVGAIREDENKNATITRTDAGSAYILARGPANTWSQVQKIVASDRTTQDQFGASVDIDDDLIIVGANQENDVNANSVGPGAAYVFRRFPAGNWVEIARLVAGDRANFDFFGQSVSISGNYAVVGAYRDSEDETGANTVNGAGSVYIFERKPSGAWVQLQKLVASDREAYDSFGFSVCIDGDYIIVGARGDDHDASGGSFLTGSGSAYIFEKAASGLWVEVQKIVAGDRGIQDNFGFSVSISGNTALVGAYDENHDEFGNNSIENTGSAYFFERLAPGSWAQVKKATASDREENALFGYSVSVSDSLAVIGAYQNDLRKGGAYVFFRPMDTGVWGQTQKLTASDKKDGAEFGFTVSVNCNHIIVGAHREPNDQSDQNPLTDAGAAYIFHTCAFKRLFAK